MTPFRLEGRTALVTGASRGIGEAVARRLAAHGARVVLAARSAERLEEMAGELANDGAEALAFPLDLAEPGSLDARVKELPGEWAAVDILVNNAGITADNLILRMSQEDWDRVLATNLTGAFALTRALCRGMVRRRWGRVINVTSVSGLMGNAGQANYASAKAGLVGLTKSLARELASRAVTVNAVAPGYIHTAMTEALPEATRDEVRGHIPLARMGEPDDIAWACLYLASEEAGYVTGHVLNVSGGLYI